MRSLCCRNWQAGVLGVLAVGLVWVACRPASEDNPAVTKGGGLGLDFGDELRRAEQLQVRQKIVSWSYVTKRSVTDELIARRLTLFEAAAVFHAVDRVRYPQGRPVPIYFPGKTEEERLCRQVIASVDERLHNRPDREAVVARLEQELQEHLRRYGAVQLPEFRPPEGIPWFKQAE
jgi:hypothetical protein